MADVALLPVLLPDEPKWDEQHVAELREWIVKPVGQRLLQRLIFSRPAVVASERDRRNQQSDERAGFEACIAELLDLAASKAARS